MGHMKDAALEALALDILDGAEVMQEFDDHLWIKVDRHQWEEFIGPSEED